MNGDSRNEQSSAWKLSGSEGSCSSGSLGADGRLSAWDGSEAPWLFFYLLGFFLFYSSSSNLYPRIRVDAFISII